MPEAKITTEVINRFKKNTYYRGTDQCWDWKLSTNKYGYPNVTINQVAYRAHRIAFLIEHGYLNQHKQIHHTCGNKICVNPKHLVEGESLKGEEHGSAKLTDEQVLDIRNDPRPQYEIAIEYDICQATVSYIKNRIRWKHL